MRHPRHLRHLRHHRKSLPHPDPRWRALTPSRLAGSLWQPGQLNWWIGTVFAVGSALFALGGLLSLQPALAAHWGLDTAQVNAVFFAGSIPFTTAAYLQLFQAANATGSLAAAARPRWFGWRPGNIGWLSCALQFAGTLLFNLNTWDAMRPDLDWLQQDLAIWLPDMAGSVLFLASGYLAFVECCRAYWAWHHHSLSWWVTFVNLLGCVAFMASALLAFVPRAAPDADVVNLSLLFTTLGAIAFLGGSLLMLPESVE